MYDISGGLVSWLVDFGCFFPRPRLFFFFSSRKKEGKKKKMVEPLLV